MKTAQDAYPPRPAFFAEKFTRLMAKVCLANDVGPAGCWLLTMVAHTECARHYSGPVTFWNDQLFALTGLGSVAALDRLRKKLIKSGWLGYQSGGKGRAGRYWVIRPERYKDIPDGPSDEHDSKYVMAELENQAEDNRKVNGRQPKDNRKTTERQPKDNRKLSAEHSYKTLVQDPSTNTSDPPADAGRVDPPPTAIAVAPKPKPPDPLFDAVAEITSSDPKASGSHIGRVRTLLAKADPPYTPAEVREFGRRYPEVCPWAKVSTPTLGEVEKYIGRVRSPPGAIRQTGQKTKGELFEDYAARMAGGGTEVTGDGGPAFPDGF